MTMDFPLNRNIIALYFVKVAKWMNLVMPVIVLFYQSNGLTMQDIFTLKAVYSATLMLLEIPTGFFADFAGRRTSIFLGSLLGFGGYLIYSTSGGFWEFVVAETVLGVGMSLVSGADSAMLYDSLATSNATDKYTRYEGRMTSVGNFAEAFAGITGGFLAAISLQTPFWFQTAVAFIALPASLLLKEPPVHLAVGKIPFKEILVTVQRVFRSDRRLLWSVLFSAVTGVSTLTMAWFVQPFFIAAELSVSLYGVVWAGLNLAVGATAISAWRIEESWGSKRTLLMMTFSLLIPYFAVAILLSNGVSHLSSHLAFFSTGLLLLVVFYLARGIATPTLRHYINIHSSSDVRATVLSIRNFIIRGLFAILGPFFGWLTDRFSLAFALLFAGLLFSLFSGISLLYMLKTRAFRK